MKTLGFHNVALIALVVSYYIVVGADIYAQAAITPVALEAPPRSLAMFQGEYVYDAAPFWRVTTTLTMVLFAVALGVNWKTTRRRLLLGAFLAFLVINIVSFAYIFPEYLDIVGSVYSDTVDPELVSRGAAWRKLALGRWAVVTMLGVFPLVALAKPSATTV